MKESHLLKYIAGGNGVTYNFQKSDFIGYYKSYVEVQIQRGEGVSEGEKQEVEKQIFTSFLQMVIALHKMTLQYLKWTKLGH